MAAEDFFVSQAVEALLKTTTAVSNATILGTGRRNVNYPGVTGNSNSVPKVASFTESQEAVSSSDDLLQVTDLSSINFEFEKGTSQSVKGNLKRNISFWRSIGKSKFILDVIERGYKLPFETLPESVLLKNNKSAEKHADFVGEAILELVNS